MRFRDVSDPAVSRTTSGRQWSSSTSSGGAQRLVILRRYPYPVYGTAGPVGGGPLQTCAHELVRSGCDANRPNLGDLRQRQTASFFCISQKKSRLTTQHLRHYDTMAVRRLSPTPSFWATHSSHIRSLYRSDARGACGCLRASIEAKDRPDRRRITHVRIGSSRIFQDLHH